MCDTCGCNVTPGNRSLAERPIENREGVTAVHVLENLLHDNDHQAAHNREHFDRHGVLALNLMSSPGAGKTCLLEETIEALKDRYRIAVIEGDLETENDAARIRAHDVTAIQITTGTACHLDAHLVHEGVHRLNLENLDIVFIENVGNLVCPASFDLGQHHDVVLLSTPEGDDKPSKYPVMFRAADLVLITKTDLLAVLDDFDVEAAQDAVRRLANPAPVIQLSARTKEGFGRWITWVTEAVAHREHTVAPEHAHDHVASHAHRHDGDH